jgi:hypothetical protein
LRGGCYQYNLAIGSTDLVFVIVGGFIDADLAEGADALAFHEHHVALDETVAEDCCDLMVEKKKKKGGGGAAETEEGGDRFHIHGGSDGGNGRFDLS